MILEFNDGSQLEILRIFGSKHLIQGVYRDVLSIQIDQSANTIDNLKSIFADSNKTNHLYTPSEDTDDKGNIINVTTEIGEGYNLLLSVEPTRIEISAMPGKIVPPKYQDIYVVSIAQMTYDEYKEFLAKNNLSNKT